MTLVVHLPRNRESERSYVARVLLETFLGQRVQIEHEDRRDTLVMLGGDSTRTLVIDDGLFATPESEWLSESVVPRLPLRMWTPPASLNARLRHRDTPILFGRPLTSGDFAELSEEHVHLSADLLGGAFLLLTRLEEVVSPVEDTRGRYPATASLLYRASLLHRAVVNEYVEVLWAALARLWPALRRPARDYRVLPTHDVDRPYCTWQKPLAQVARQAAGDIVRRHHPRLAARRAASAIAVRVKGPEADICNTFSWIMQESEDRGLRSAFYFLRRSTDAIDSDYEFTDAPIASLMRGIHARGHEVGLHPTYGSFRSAATIKLEFQQLREAADSCGIRQPTWGGRQHYLRWNAAETWRHWSSAGLDYDSSAGFADAPGFRCGTCFEFPVFDVIGRQSLPLRERPLVVMEASLVRDDVSGSSWAHELERATALVDECRYYSGDFVLLWHNNRLVGNADRKAYLAILDHAVRPRYEVALDA